MLKDVFKFNICLQITMKYTILFNPFVVAFPPLSTPLTEKLCGTVGQFGQGQNQIVFSCFWFCQAQPIASSSWLRLAFFPAFPHPPGHPASHPTGKVLPSLAECCNSAISLQGIISVLCWALALFSAFLSHLARLGVGMNLRKLNANKY